MKSDEHWDDFYKNKCGGDERLRISPSPFAEWIAPLIRPTDVVADLGCGPGGDSIFFSNIAKHVFAVDMSSEALKWMNLPNNVEKINDDFISFCQLYSNISVYYSRFTFHCLDMRQQAEFISCLSNNAKNGSILALEARSVGDDLYGKGEPAGPHAFIDGHYRCFVDIYQLNELLAASGHWDILFWGECRGWSKFNDTDPMLVRIIARKK